MGSFGKDAEEVMEHEWFAGINWNLLLNKKIKPPKQIKLSTELGGNFDKVKLKRNLQINNQLIQ